jgi:hypothetical protein
VGGEGVLVGRDEASRQARRPLVGVEVDGADQDAVAVRVPLAGPDAGPAGRLEGRLHVPPAQLVVVAELEVEAVVGAVGEARAEAPFLDETPVGAVEDVGLDLGVAEDAVRAGPVEAGDLLGAVLEQQQPQLLLVVDRPAGVRVDDVVDDGAMGGEGQVEEEVGQTADREPGLHGDRAVLVGLDFREGGGAGRGGGAGVGVLVELDGVHRKRPSYGPSGSRLHAVSGILDGCSRRGV